MKVLTFEKVPSKRHAVLLDFVVSGKSILAELDRRGYDLVPRVRDGLVPVDQTTRANLLLEEDDELQEEGRVALYICPCGDYGCGVVSVLIEKDGSHFVWSKFRYENDYDGEFTSLEKLGPFRFDERAYRDMILGKN